MLPITVDLKSFSNMDDEQFYKFCVDNPDLQIERDSNFNIIFMSPVNFKASQFNSFINTELSKWFSENEKGVLINDSSCGFTLSNNAVRSPDAAWISEERMSSVTETEKEKFPKVCPDFVVEIISSKDDEEWQKNKMKEWITNGVRLGWLINPKTKMVFIYRENQNNFEKAEWNILIGENILGGLKIDLRKFRF
ncbi:MAG: Uma2 family endonuclease [Bacteroidia bacterium]